MAGGFIIEVCVNSIQSAIAAQLGGAHRIELCDNINEGGTTPSLGLIQQVRKKLTIDLNVIIRPRGGDFLYDVDDFETMKRDIVIAKENGVDGVVLGILLQDGGVDSCRTKELVDLAYPMNVTFHRAFDVSKDPFKSLEDIINCGCQKILTSGMQQVAYDGIDLIQKLIYFANNRIVIMPGSGIVESNVKEICDKTGAKEFHVSLRNSVKSNMKFINDRISFNNITGLSDIEMKVTDEKRIKEIIKILEDNSKNIQL